MVEVLPLKNLNDLLFWTIPQDLEPVLNKLEYLHCKSTSVQLPEETIPEYLVKTLICHDDGGYKDDRFCNGTTNEEAYRFYNWSCIDVFVYFSHNFITIPPVGWTQTAHIQGVKVLGTMITEWEEGAVIWDEILSDEEIMEVVINNLVAIAKTFKFEGWLLNFENKISPAKVDALIKFSHKLTQRMHTINSNSEVIWYDSVTCKGDLDWQNELNSLNQCFFDVCDGIFLNYQWDEKCLENSVLAAKGRQLNIYVGMDVYGRNFYAGGGFNLCKALQLIRKYNLSVAIFAQSWTFYELGLENFFANENRLWKTLKSYLLYHGTTRLPLNTSFCQGFGKKQYKDGCVVKDETWFNLNHQQIQPLWNEFSRLDVPFSIMTESAFNGGSCLSFWLDDEISIRLMICEIEFAVPLEFSFAYEVSHNIKMIWFTISIQLNHDSDPTTWCNFSFVCEWPKDKELRSNSSTFCSEKKTNNWKVKKFLFPSDIYEGGCIRNIKLCGAGPGLIKLGNVSIAEAE